MFHYIAGTMPALLLTAAVILWPAACGNSRDDDVPRETKSGAISELAPTDSVTLSSGVVTLTLPEEFDLSLVAENLPGASSMVMDRFGNLWVSRPDYGTVTLLEMENGRARNQMDIFTGLNHPSGLAMDPREELLLYIAEENAVSRVSLYTEDTLHRLADLPAGGENRARGLLFDSDGRLYVSIGASCNACEEQDERRAAIYVLERDGGGFRKFAGGLRNVPAMALNPATGTIWAAERGTEYPDGNRHPDEINLIHRDAHYGWPWCYGDRTRDARFEAGKEPAGFCAKTVPPVVFLPPGASPSGLGFVPGEGWPGEYRLDLLVTLRGPENGAVPFAPSVMRYPLDDRGNYTGSSDPFISGWHRNGAVSGRPSGLLLAPRGVMFVSDALAGAVYRVYRTGPGDTVSDDIRVESPDSNTVISPPLIVSGSARGTWYFEGSFMVRLLDGDGSELAISPARAQGSWMTEDFVPFRARLEYASPGTDMGTVVIEKANPSGLPENAREIRIPVRFR